MRHQVDTVVYCIEAKQTKGRSLEINLPPPQDKKGSAFVFPQVGKAMSSNETAAYEIMKSLDVDYVLIIFGGVIGYSGDDINKFLWMVRIAEGEHPRDIRVRLDFSRICLMAAVVKYLRGDATWGSYARLMCSEREKTVDQKPRVKVVPLKCEFKSQIDQSALKLTYSSASVSIGK